MFVSQTPVGPADWHHCKCNHLHMKTYIYQHSRNVPGSLGWHYLSNATCLMRPHSFYVFFFVSRITILCYIILYVEETSSVRQVVLLDKRFPLMNACSYFRLSSSWVGSVRRSGRGEAVNRRRAFPETLSANPFNPLQSLISTVHLQQT